MNIDIDRLKDLQETRHELGLEIAEIQERLKLDSLADNYLLKDKIYELKKKWADQNWESIAEDAAYISEAVNLEGSTSLDYNAYSEIVVFADQIEYRPMPGPFGLPGVRMMPGRNVMIGAYPGVGKSTFILNFLYYALMRKHRSIFFSLEMEREEVYMRAYQIFMYLSSSPDRREVYSVEEIIGWIKNRDQQQIKKLKMFFDNIKKYLLVIDNENLTASRICAVLDHSRRYFGGTYPEYVAIDYAQLIQPEQYMRRSSRREQMLEVSRLLTKKSKRSKCIMLILSQLNDKGEFMEAANFKQDCGLALKLSRELNNEGQYTESLTIKVDKNRYGAISKSVVPFFDRVGVIGRI